MTLHSPIDRAAGIVGSQRELARLLDVTPQAITKWKNTRVPAERVLEIEAATGGAISRHELRPDIYPRDAAVA